MRPIRWWFDQIGKLTMTGLLITIATLLLGIMASAPILVWLIR